MKFDFFDLFVIVIVFSNESDSLFDLRIGFAFEIDHRQLCEPVFHVWFVCVHKKIFKGYELGFVIRSISDRGIMIDPARSTDLI